MDDPETESKLKKYKLRVKIWEKDFKKKFKRIPSKHDIKEARADIKYAYKMYYKLTTSIMENTVNILNDNDFNDSIDDFGSQMSILTSQNSVEIDRIEGFSNIHQLMDNKIQIVNTVEELAEGNRKEFEAEEELKSNASAWHLKEKKVKKIAKEDQTEQQPIITPCVKEKLFANSSFNKRNPRKSFSKNKSNNPLSSNSTQERENLPDFETVLLQKSLKESPVVKLEKKISSNMSVDSGWLNRISQSSVDSSQHIENLTPPKSASIDHGTSFGISKLLIENKENDSDNSVISNSEDESMYQHQSQIMKRRKISDVLDIATKREEESIIYSPKEKNTSTSSNKSLRSNRNPIKYYDSDDKSEEDPYADNSDEDLFIPEEEEKEVKKKVSPKVTKSKLKNEKATRFTKSKSSKPAIEEDPQNPEPYISTIDLLDNVVPRLNIKELQKSSEKFNDYLINEPKISKQKLNPQEIMTDAERKADIAKSKLLNKIASGKLNENFVKIDINKKVYVRGKKNVNFSRFKKSEWKKKKKALAGPNMDMGGCDGGVLTCFQCGGVGHFAQNCKTQEDKLLPVDVEEDSPFPTLEEAEEMSKSKLLLAHSRRPENIPTISNEYYKHNIEEKGDNTILNDDNIEQKDNPILTEFSTEKSEPSYIGHKIPEEFLKKSGIMDLSSNSNDKVIPLYKLQPDGAIPDAPEEVFDVLKKFGHSSFRFGQEQAVMRILCGLSTLVTLSTGSGKSLCYQLPAYLYHKYHKCITLVISPLVSLMEDQVHGVPGFLNAQCLHTNQTLKTRENVLAMIKSGQVDVLLISPEAIVAGEKSTTGFGKLLKELPPIAFVCIDEAHCVSQWSHNFRPSYLMISRVIKQKLGIKTILGLTATATCQTRSSIVTHLEVPDGLKGVISDVPLPDNLILTVSKDQNRDSALLHLIRSERFSNLNSIIVYCTRRDECERIAGLLRTSLQGTASKYRNEENASKKRKRNDDLIAESYHAGMAASRRRAIQNSFMKGNLRIVVATIAFGMGINKADIRGIIHYNMPKSYESYVQEVGRAGRDGEIAHCHLFLEGNDKTELKRHIYANSIDRHVIRKLLKLVFLPCVCGSDKTCPGHEVAFSVESTVQLLDIPEENISTLLCYLELHTKMHIQVLSKGYIKAKVQSYGGPSRLKAAAKSSPPLAMAIAMDLKRNISHEDSNFVEFPVVDTASSMGWDSGIVKYNLKKLEWIEKPGEKAKKSNITVTFSDLGFRVRAPGNLTDEELDETLDLLFNRVSKQEKTEIIQLHNVFEGLYFVAENTFHQISKPDLNLDKSIHLKTVIRNYFQNETFDDKEYNEIEKSDAVESSSVDHITSDIFTIISRYPDNNFTGRAIARIFHGIQSPNYPAVIWGRCKFWRAHQKADFKMLIKIATEIIVRMRTQ